MVCSPYLRSEGYEADEEGDRDVHPDLGGGVLQPREECVEPYAPACVPEGDADRGNHDAEDPERDGIAGGPALGCGKNSEGKMIAPNSLTVALAIGQLTENGVRLPGVPDDGHDESERRGCQCDGEKERVADPSHRMECGARGGPEQQRAGETGEWSAELAGARLAEVDLKPGPGRAERPSRGAPAH